MSINYLPNGRYCIQNRNNKPGHYVNSTGPGGGNTIALSYFPCCFILTNEFHGCFSLRCGSTHKYVSTEGKNHMTCNKDNRKDWELFRYMADGSIQCFRDGFKDSWNVDGDRYFIHHHKSWTSTFDFKNYDEEIKSAERKANLSKEG